jgi:signal transduction histidine kinase
MKAKPTKFKPIRTERLLLFFVLAVFFACTNSSNKKLHRFDSVLKNARVYIENGEEVKVRSFLDSSYAVTSNLTSHEYIKKYQLLAELYYYFKPNYDLASLYLDSMENILSAYSNEFDDETELFLLLHRGRIAMSQQKFEDAFFYHYKAKLKVEDLNDPCQSQKYAFALAMLLYRQEGYRDAIYYFLESLQKGESCNAEEFDHFLLQRLINPNNVALCYERLDMLDSALFYYQNGLNKLEEAVKRYPDKNNVLNKTRGVYYGNIGSVMLKQKKYDLARVYLNKSIEQNYHPEKDMKDAIYSKIKLAALEVELGNKGAALSLINELQDTMPKYSDLDAQGRLADVMYRYYGLVGNYENALYHQKLKYQLNDSLQKLRNQIILKNSYVKEFEKVKNKVELDYLIRENKVKSWFLLTAVSAAILFVVIIVLFGISRRQQRKYIAELEELNKAVSLTNHRLESSLNSLEQSYSENEKLIKIVAHDLRSPLAAIVGALDLVGTDILSEEEKPEFINMSRESSMKALNLINDLLQPKEKGTELEKIATDLKSLIESSVNIIIHQADQKRQTLEMNCPSVIVSLNESKIWRVMNNILANAVKFSPVGAKIKITTEVFSEHVIISVKDSGIGIPEHIRDNLFDLFTKASRKGTNGEETYGLGLAISKQIVEAHNGEIWFKSEPGKGTTFFVMLPR